MLASLKSFLSRMGKSTDRSRPDEASSAEQNEKLAAPASRPVSTWQERAAAVGALIEPGQKPDYTPIGVATGKPRAARAKPAVGASNPLQLRGKALSDFLGQVDGLERYEAAERTRKRLGSVDGRHYSTYAAEVKQLIRDGDHSAAIAILHRLVAAAKSEASFSGDPVPPWYRATLDSARAKMTGSAPSKRKRKSR